MVTDEHGWIQKMPIICRCWDHLTPWSVLENAAKPPRECPIAPPKKAGRVWGQRWKGLHEPWEIVKLEMIEQTNRRLHQENKHVEQLWTQGRQNDLGRKKKELEISMTLASINLINHTHFYRSMTLHDFACSSLRASLWSLASKSVPDVKWSLFNF